MSHVLSPTRICLTPQLVGVGGMVSFQYKLAAGLEKRGIQVTYDLADWPYAAVLIIGGTRHLSKLLYARRRGARLVQRLDGMNWLHWTQAERDRRRTDWHYFLRAEIGNWLLALIRSRLAQRIVYQSEFSRRWWEQRRGLLPTPAAVIYNGVDLQIYTPLGEQERPHDRYRLLMVEGSLMGGYEHGLEAAVQLLERLSSAYPERLDRPVELMVVGRVPEEVRRAWQARTNATLVWAGVVDRQAIPAIDRSAHLLYSSDIHPACPNSVIEALACGLPVAAFDTGALPELVTPAAGCIVPYGSNPWRLEAPDTDRLAREMLSLLQHSEQYRAGARQRALEVFDLDLMVERYLAVLL